LPATCLNDIDLVILAGGFGTRLRPVVPDRPKALALVDGVPFLRRYLDWMGGFGARRVILALGFQAEMVKDFVKSEDWHGMGIESSVETEPLGTGGAVRAVLPLIRAQTALVANGDSFTRVDVCRFVDFHRRKRARVSLLLTWQPDAARFARVETGEDDAVAGFHEKPSDAAGGYINAGLYLMSREAIGEIPAGRPVSIEKDVFPKFCGHGFYGMKGEFPFIDIGTPESYRRAAEFFQQEAA
jgi:NDP-sugar pyrophosphorylase family protein